jgi:hypothetical protein
VLKLVLECKLFMYRQMLEGAPGAWLHFHSFMKDKYKYGRLFAIHECSTLQSSDLDRLINTAILDEHQTNRPSSSVMAQQQKRSYNRIIVEGIRVSYEKVESLSIFLSIFHFPLIIFLPQVPARWDCMLPSHFSWPVPTCYALTNVLNTPVIGQSSSTNDGCTSYAICLVQNSTSLLIT